ncbi:MAG: hypothetical protein ACTSU0_06190, partial [Alphaproteobacteria bacterium]
RFDNVVGTVTLSDVTVRDLTTPGTVGSGQAIGVAVNNFAGTSTTANLTNVNISDITSIKGATPSAFGMEIYDIANATITNSSVTNVTSNDSDSGSGDLHAYGVRFNSSGAVLSTVAMNGTTVSGVVSNQNGGTGYAVYFMNFEGTASGTGNTGSGNEATCGTDGFGPGTGSISFTSPVASCTP